MSNTFTRQELYDLVWSEPMSKLKSRFGISDVAVAKMCRRNGIPIPNRGYWAKLQAGKPVFKPKLTHRAIGMPETITFGGSARHNWLTSEQILAIPDSPTPEFSEPIEEVRARVKKVVKRVAFEESLERTHPAIGRLISEDSERIQKQKTAKYSWLDKPLFQSPLEQRRLAIVNSLFIGLHQAGANATCRGKDPKEFEVRVGEQGISFTLDTPGMDRHGYRTEAQLNLPSNSKLELQITNWQKLEGSTSVWVDAGTYKIERHLTEIAIEMIVRGEMTFRAGEISRHRWLIERKGQILEEIENRKAEKKRQHEENLRKAEQAKIDRLLLEAAEFRKAAEIRHYISCVQAATVNLQDHISQIEVEIWSAWANAQADKIDPVVSRKFLEVPSEG